MIYALTKAVGDRFKLAKIPCAVVYGEERFTRGIISQSRIVVAEDGEDQWGPPMTTRMGTDPARWSCAIAIAVGIEAVDTRQGALRHDHCRLARRLARAFASAVRDELAQERWRSLVLEHRASGGFVRLDAPTEVGARYALDMRVLQAVAWERNIEDVDAADLTFAPTVIVGGEAALGGP